jgi:dihydroneopterin aldolase
MPPPKLEQATLNTIPKPAFARLTGFINQTASQSGNGYRILVTDLIVPWRIGVRRHEEDRRQRVRINLDIAVSELPDAARDDYRNVLCYEDIVERIREMASTGHVKLVETLAQRVAALCLSDPRAERVTVRVEKLDAVPDAGSVGVEMTRYRTD